MTATPNTTQNPTSNPAAPTRPTPRTRTRSTTPPNRKRRSVSTQSPGADSTLPRGVTRRTLRNGQTVYLAQDGTGTGRRSGTFTDLADAAAYKTYLATCRHAGDTPLPADEWRNAANGKRVRGTSYRTLLDAALTEKTRTRPRSARSYRTHHRAALNVLDRIGIDPDQHHRRLAAATARNIRDQLATDGYATGSATPILDMFATGARLAEADRTIDTNPFTDLRAIEQKGTRRAGHTGRKAPAFELHHLAAIATALPHPYRTPFWLAAGTGMRISELFGLQLDDWNADTGWLSIRRQRRSGNHTSDTTKTSAGERHIPLAGILRDLLDDYIADHHDHNNPGTYLIVGTRNRTNPGPMDPDALRTAIRRALAETGINTNVGGDIAPLHHLRTTLISWLAADPDVPPAMTSVYVGHRTSQTSEPGIAAASRITTYYTRATSEGLTRVASGIDRLLTRIKTTYDLDDLVTLPVPDRTITVEQAAETLGVSIEDIVALIAAGDLRAHHHDPRAGAHPREHQSDGSSEPDREITPGNIRLDADAVRDLARTNDTRSQQSIPSTQAAKRLRMSLSTVRRLVTEGELDGHGDPSDRPKLRGVTHGNLSGGQRITLTSIETFEQNHRERFTRLATWPTAPQAARIAGVSADTIRRRCDRNELGSWTDPYNRRSERRVNPDDLARLVTATQQPATGTGTVGADDGIAELGAVAWELLAALQDPDRRRRQRLVDELARLGRQLTDDSGQVAAETG